MVPGENAAWGLSQPRGIAGGYNDGHSVQTRWPEGHDRSGSRESTTFKRDAHEPFDRVHDSAMIQTTARTMVIAGALLLSPEAAAADRSAVPQSADFLIAQALRHEHGEGVTRNGVRAAELYCEAARMGSADAACRLGWMYANGRGIERDDGYAAALFQRAARQGHGYAQRMIQWVRSGESRLPPCLAASGVAATAPRALTTERYPDPSAALVAKAELEKIEQFALAERARAEAALSDLAKAQQSIQVERARAESAIAQLAKTEQLVQAERARAETAGAELAKVEQAIQAQRARAELAFRAQSAPGAPAPPDSAGDAAARAEISTALANWARAWSRRDFDAYRAAYAKDIAGRSYRQWQQQRRARIVGRSWIDVRIADLQVEVEGSQASARFRQDYRSDRFNDTSIKTLTLIKLDRNWLILRERSEN